MSKLILLFLLLPIFIQAQTQLESALSEIHGMTLEKVGIPDGSHFNEAYHLILNQPNDHSNPQSGYFQQHLYLMHVDPDKPILFETEGYQAYNTVKEVSKLLKCNQLIVEYRYYGKSKPDSIPWKYLNNNQASEDYHRIRQLFSNLYQGKWISSGFSKGGETTLIYKSKFPGDVDLSVVYVAPMIISTEDPRTDFFLDTIKTDACRKKLIAFQRFALQRRDEILPLLKNYAADRKTSFEVLTINGAYEYAILEYPFSFWQRTNGDCKTIPDAGCSATDIFKEIERTGGWSWVTDRGIMSSLQSTYQHQTELGYYAYVTKYVRDLLEVVCDGSNAVFWPFNDIPLVYDFDYMGLVRTFLRTQGNDIIYVYGGHDTWSACAMQLEPNQTNAIQIFVPGKGHDAKIADCPVELRQKIYHYIEQRANVKIYE